MRAVFRLAALAAPLFAVATPASAERVHTYWRLEPTSTLPTSATYNVPFLELRLLPVHLVKTTITHEMVAQGTPLYLVFNDAGQIGYCTLKDRSLGNQAKTLFMPILDQRPCFVDSDRDGRFDQSFSVFDKGGGLPSVRGTFSSAKPLAVPISYASADIHELPSDLSVSLKIVGKRDPRKSRINFQFSRNLGARWFDVWAEKDLAEPTYIVLNNAVRIRSVSGDQAQIDVMHDPNFLAYIDNRNNIFMGQLPPFVLRHVSSASPASGAVN